MDAIQQDQEPPSNPPQAIPLQVPQTTNPINEFTSNDENFFGTCPTLFPQGCGLRNPVSIPKAEAVHMLNQHSGIFGDSATLIFIMFNQTQRHTVVNSLTPILVLAGTKNYRSVEFLRRNSTFFHVFRNTTQPPTTTTMVSRLPLLRNGLGVYAQSNTRATRLRVSARAL